MESNAFLKRSLLAVAISALSLTSVAYAHGGGGHGTGGSAGGGSSSSSSSSGSGHSSSSTSGGHSATASKGGRSASDPTDVATGPTDHSGRSFHTFEQHGSGYNSQNTGANNEDSRRKHHGLLFGFIRY
jgi:hypothetical protein